MSGVLELERVRGLEHLLLERAEEFRRIEAFLGLSDGLAGGCAGAEPRREPAADALLHRLGRDAVLTVERDLTFSAALGFLDGVLHRGRHPVGVHDDTGVNMARRTTHLLDETRRAAKKALLVSVQNAHQRDLGQVQTLAQEVDAHEHVEFAGSEVGQDLDALERLDVTVEVAHTEALVVEILREVFAQALGESGDEHALATGRPLPAALEQVRHLAASRLDLDDRIEQSRGPDDLLDHDALAFLEFVRPGCGAHVEGLRDAGLELLEAQRPIVHRAGQAEAVLDEDGLAGAVAVEHGAQLRERDVALVDDEQPSALVGSHPGREPGAEIVGVGGFDLIGAGAFPTALCRRRRIVEVVEESERFLARLTLVEPARVILDARAVPDLFDHLQVVSGAREQALRFEQPAPAAQLHDALVQFDPDPLQDRAKLVLGHDVMHSREQEELGLLGQQFARGRLDEVQSLDLIAEQVDAEREAFVGGPDLDAVAAHAVAPALGVGVVAPVLHGVEREEERASVDVLAPCDRQDALAVRLGRPEPEYARDRCHDDHVAPREDVARGREAELVKVVVSAGVLLDIDIALGYVRLGLVVVVIAHEVVDGIVGEELTQLLVQLGGEGLVVADDQGRPTDGLDDIRHGEGLARARGAQQARVPLAGQDAPGELLDRAGLIALGRERGHDAELSRCVRGCGIVGHDQG